MYTGLRGRLDVPTGRRIDNAWALSILGTHWQVGGVDIDRVPEERRAPCSPALYNSSSPRFLVFVPLRDRLSDPVLGASESNVFGIVTERVANRACSPRKASSIIVTVRLVRSMETGTDKPKYHEVWVLYPEAETEYIARFRYHTGTCSHIIVV